MQISSMAALAAIAIAVAPPALAQKSKDTLRVGAYQPISLIDTFYAAGPEETLAARMVFDPLIHYDVDKREFVGGLAESWKRIDDLTMEFKLRQGVKFHDGQPVTMDDVEYTHQFVVDPKANYRFQITRINWVHDKHFEKIDDRTFRLRSKEPMAAMLGKLTNFPPIYPKHLHSKLEKKQAFGQNAIGTGPMRIAEFSTTTGVTLVKNPEYKHGNAGKPAVQISRVRIDPVPDHQTQMARVIRGEQDLMFNVDKDQADALSKNPDFRVDVQDAVSFNWVTFDVQARSGPGAKMFADKRVRLALLHAIDRNDLNHLIHPAVAKEKPLAVVCHPKLLHCASTVEPPRFDPALAKKLLTDAGYPDGFETTILTWGEAKDTAEAVAGMWRKIGVRAGVETATFGTFIKKRAEGVPTMVTLWDNSVGQPDIDNTAEYFFMPSPRNYNKDPVIEKLALQGRSELDPKKRTEIYRQMFDKAADEAYLMPLHRIPAVVVHHKDVKLLGGHLHPKGFEINRVAWN